MKNSYRVIVTGASGFAGTNWMNYSSRAGNIDSVPLGRSDLKEGNDLTSLFNTTDTIIHLAGKAHDLKKVSDPAEYYAVNFDLTKRLYEMFLRSQARKFIYISSVKAAADEVPGVLDEAVTPTPTTHYGKSKLLAENFIREQALPPGKQFFILRPCMIHGPGNKGNLNLLYGFVKRKLPWPFAAFDNKRSFLGIENLCFVMKELIERNDIPCDVYNIADDEALSTNALVKLIANELGTRTRFLKLPRLLVRSMAKSGDMLKLPFNTESLQKLTASYVVSNKKIKKVLQKEFPVSTEEGIRQTIRSF